MIDPLNGYGYWLEGRNKLIRQNWGCKPAKDPEVLLEREHLGPFLLDRRKNEILVIDIKENELLKVQFSPEVNVT